MNRKYFSLEKEKNVATLNIYGDITSWPYFEGDTSSAGLSNQLDKLQDVDRIDVYINSYGGEVKEGIAIYNALKRHKAKIRTVCDGFACSIASVIFMAGDERVMNDASLLMIHNAWTYAEGNAENLRKQADDLEKITQASVEAYKAHSNLSEDEIKSLMDAETWILPTEAVEYGFATEICKTETNNASQNARKKLFEIVMEAQDEPEDGEPDDEETDDVNTDEGEPETDDSDGEDETPEDEPEEDPEEAEDETPEDEPPEDEEETEVEDEETDAEDENPAQKWSGFFNAITKF